MDINEKIKVMQHYADGGEVEKYLTDRNDWYKTDHPSWNWSGNTYRIKPEPTPQSLEDRIKAEYPEYEVKEIKDNGYGVLSPDGTSAHVLAQSMKGFAGYVYEGLIAEGTLSKRAYSICQLNDEIIHPIAVLFTKDSKEEA